MPYTETDDGVSLYYEERGHGEPIIFVHEFAGDHRSWEPQLRYFSQHFRVIAYNARGYPPSQVPEAVSSYSQDRAADDIAAVLHHLGIARAHVIGLSMGAFAALHFGFRHPAVPCLWWSPGAATVRNSASANAFAPRPTSAPLQ